MMKISSEKAVNIAVPLFVKFILEAKKLGYNYENTTFSDINYLKKDANISISDQKLIKLYDAFIAKLKQEMSANKIRSWLYVGKKGIKFANIKKVIFDYFCPQNVYLGVSFGPVTWNLAVNYSSIPGYYTNMTLDEVAKEHETDFESIFMEMLRDYEPEIVSHNIIKTKLLIEAKNAICNNSFLSSGLAEAIEQWGPFVSSTHNMKCLQGKVIFMERYNDLMSITF